MYKKIDGKSLIVVTNHEKAIKLLNECHTSDIGGHAGMLV